MLQSKFMTCSLETLVDIPDSKEHAHKGKVTRQKEVARDLKKAKNRYAT
jgi:hypothetical protein